MFNDLKEVCNQKVFRKLYLLHARNLKSFLIFKFNDVESAEDLTQDAFIKLWENCESIPFSKAKSFLFTVANNAFLNIKKHEQVKQKHKKVLVKDSTNESPEFILLEKEFYEKLDRVIDSLSEKQRDVFLMNRIEKLKYKEIANELNISVKAVEKRMHLALKVIHKEIGKI